MIAGERAVRAQHRGRAVDPRREALRRPIAKLRDRYVMPRHDLADAVETDAISVRTERPERAHMHENDVRL